jgi:hypothetical protein
MPSSAGTWSWWHSNRQVVVGQLSTEQFAEDVPVVVVRDARDAQLLVAVLDYLDAKTV